MENIKETIITKVLPNVQKPARYSGGEFNIRKMKPDAGVHMALCFPDTYEIGMSHLGMKILYSLVNDLDYADAERVFAPAKDMADELKKHQIPLYGLESYRPLNDFDIVGFSLQYEMSLTTVLYMLELGNIPLRARDRSNSDPVVIAGGPCCINPEPFCEIFDLIMIGETEETLPELLKLKEECPDKDEFLLKACHIKGCYVPAFYKESYEDGKIKSREKLEETAPDIVERSFISDFNKVYFPESFVVPFIEIVHDRVMEEIMRGCPRGCRFCQAGSIYRPVRFKTAETIKKQAMSLIDTTGYDEISLTGLSTTDYPKLNEVIDSLLDEVEKKKFAVTLPSLRIDKFDVQMLKKIQKMRLGMLTFAPEAGSQRMRDVINKNISEEDIFNTINKALDEGYTKFKLYFMIGLPYETDEDVSEIAHLANKILYNAFDRIGRGKINLSISVANFVPKPFTPFEFVAQNHKEEFTRKHDIIRGRLNKRIRYTYHDSSLSQMEAAFARGDRRLNDVLISAYENGCIFDSWQDYYDEEKWYDAFKKNGLSVEEFAYRDFSYDDKLSWDFVDNHVTKEFYERENERSKEAKTTPNCFEKCSACGVSTKFGRCDFEI